MTQSIQCGQQTSIVWQNGKPVADGDACNQIQQLREEVENLKQHDTVLGSTCVDIFQAGGTVVGAVGGIALGQLTPGFVGDDIALGVVLGEAGGQWAGQNLGEKYCPAIIDWWDKSEAP